MKKTYVITVTTKGRVKPPTNERIEGAVFGCGQHFDDIRNVSVLAHGKGKRITGVPLFSYAERTADGWRMLDYYNSRRKADNAAKRASANCPDRTFAVMRYHSTGCWAQC